MASPVLTQQQIQGYYKVANIELPPDPQFRHFRFRTGKDHWFKVYKKVHSPEDLRKFLVPLYPLDAYVTVSRWLNPTLLGPKKPKDAGFKILKNHFLGSEYVMDFDVKDFESVEETQKMYERAVNTLVDMGFHRFEFIQTGGGYQLWVLDFEERWVKKRISHPLSNENHYMHRMRKLTQILRDKDISWDHKVSCDTRRVVRIWNSLHRSGVACRKLHSLPNPDTRVFIASDLPGVDDLDGMMCASLWGGGQKNRFTQPASHGGELPSPISVVVQ